MGPKLENQKKPSAAPALQPTCLIIPGCSVWFLVCSSQTMSRGGQRREWTGEEEVPLPCLLPQADDLVTLNQPSILLGASPSVGQGQGSSTDPSYMLRPSWGAEAFTAHFSTEGKMDNAPVQGTKPLCSSGLHAVALEVLTCTLPAQQQSPRSGFPHALLSTCSPLLLLFFSSPPVCSFYSPPSEKCLEPLSSPAGHLYSPSPARRSS